MSSSLLRAPANILVPGTASFGLLRNFAKLASSQVMSPFAIASEYLKPAAAPDLCPTTPLRLGPTPFFPLSRLWQALHWALYTFSPAATSPAASASPAATENASAVVSATRLSLSISGPPFQGCGALGLPRPRGDRIRFCGNKARRRFPRDSEGTLNRREI